MSNGEIKYLGVTPPISTDPPKPSDLQASEALLNDLISLSQFESEPERKVRERLLSNIAQLVSKFVHDVSIKSGMSEKVASEAGGRIYTSGSYRLGVHGPGSDIDTICVCPRHIFREHFFGEFRQMLQDWPAVTEISAVESAFVPLIKTVISGVEVDLLFARVNLAEAGDKLDIEKDEILRGVDDASQRSLNGPRVTDMILNLVPDVGIYRTALRAIRLWAKRRGIYSNILGFPGGVAWSLLAARICQLYPTAAPAVIVGKFFPIYYQWRWPDPVILKNIERGPSNMQHPVWNPRLDRRDQAHRMPVITPAYPSMCSTHNITASTMSVVRDEMLRAMQITDRILATPGGSWMELFEKVDFFGLYKTYVQVIAAASTSEGIKDWGGMVESRVRTLVQDLENTEIIVTAHPLMYGISKPFLCLTEEEQAAASQGELSESALKRTEADMEGKEYKKVWTKSFFVGLEIEKKTKDSSASRVLNLFYPSKRFCAACQSWDKYDEMEMSVILRPAKRSELPYYCFPDGQPKTKKKTKRGPQAVTADVADESMDGQGPSKRPKSALGSDDSRITNGISALPSTNGSSEISANTPSLQIPTLQPAPSTITETPSAVPTANAADPTPAPTNGTSVFPDMLPPPAIEGMKPLSSESMAGFASAAAGVTTEAEAAAGSNEAGLVVLNGSNGTS